MLTEGFSKEVRRWIERVRMPSAQCQACLSDKSPQRDFIFICELCQSSIHSKHYGREIEDPKDNPADKWFCQRCRKIYQLAQTDRISEIEAIRCKFCPSYRGILKRVIYNGTETIWLHPQCATWPYPIIFQKNNRRIHYNSQYPSKPTGKFWVNLEKQAQSSCQICHEVKGYKIKCMYYLCQKYYHCSCAKTIGVIRDLQSMRFDSSETYIPPYCEEHLEKRVSDCQLKIKKFKQAKDESKASHFSQMAAAYTTQLKNLQKSAKKYNEQEQIRKQMQYHVGQHDDVIQDLSFEDGPSLVSHHSDQFYEFIFDIEFPKRPKPTLHQILPQAQPRAIVSPSPVLIPVPNPQITLPPPEINLGISLLLKKASQNRPSARQHERDSQPQQSQWQSSQQYNEEEDD